MSSLQEMLDQEIAKRGPDGFMVKEKDKWRTSHALI
jgi:hypothetical protein